MDYNLLSINKSTKKNKKLTAVFENTKTKRNFGSAGMGDYTIYSKGDKKEAEMKKKAYIARHQVRENFNNPVSAGALSRWILWNKPTVSASIADFKKRFNL